LFWIGFIFSGIRPYDYFTWFLEVVPALIGFLILAFTFKRFPFTYLTYVFILIHSYVLFVGGHYTYAEVPWFNDIKEFLGHSRNNYDKIGHFMQGFVPAMIIRELFLRKQIVRKGWMPFVVFCVCLAISALYEFLEWLVALLSGESAEAFLGTQGYEWDTQSDMLLASIGAITMLVIFSKIQNKAIQKLAISAH